MIRKEFTGMLMGAVNKFEELLAAAAELNPEITKGYDAYAGEDSFFSWGAACRMQCGDMPALKVQAEALGITWLADNGDMAYTNGLTIEDFKTMRVNKNLVLVPEEGE